MKIRPVHLIVPAAVAVTIGLALPAPTIGPADADVVAAQAAEAAAATEGPPPADAPASLVIADFAFPAVAVTPGATVVVDNADGAPHTVTGDGFDVEVDGGGTATFVAPEVLGEHPFQCLIHPAMQGVLVVG